MTDHPIHDPPAAPRHRPAHVLAWAVGVAVAVAGATVAIDRAIEGAATTGDRRAVSLGATAAVAGAAVGLWARQRRGGSDHDLPTAPKAVLLVAALALLAWPGADALIDLVDHVRDRRDEPLTTVTHALRVGLAAAAAGLLVGAVAARPRRGSRPRE